MHLAMNPSAGEADTARLVSEPMDAGQGDVVKFNVWVRPEGAPDRQPAVMVEALTGGEWRRIDSAEALLFRSMAYFRVETGGAWEAVMPEGRVAAAQAALYHNWIPRGRSCIAPSGTEKVRLVLESPLRGAAGSGWSADDFLCEIVSLRRYANENADRPRLRDVVLFGADTLRQQALGCYGAAENHTPNVDQIAREGTLYGEVTTAAPWTRPSFASIFTSLYPAQHKAELHLSALPQSVTTLAEVLKDQGYFTIGFARTLFDGFVGPGTGFDQGFDAYLYSDDTEEVSEMVRKFLDLNGDALRELRGGGIVLFRHLYEPHAAFINHNPDLVRNEGGLLGTVDITFDLLFNRLIPNDPALANEADVRYVREVYNGEAAYMDRRVGEALLRLRHLGLYEKVIIALFSDHGESLNEKPGAWVHPTPYETCVRVPLILRIPGITEPGAIVSQGLVSNLDIMPTLLAALGIPAPEGLEGRNLLDPALPPPTFSFSEDRKLGNLTVRDAAMKMTVRNASVARRNDDESIRDWVLFREDSPSVYELYDLAVDPWELRDLSGERPEELQRLKAALFAHCVRMGIATREAVDAASPAHFSPEHMVLLRQMLDKGATETPALSHVGETVPLSPEAMEDIKSQGYVF
ncbi:MAG: sulfatase-like hydrolase/transferase [Candidatus Hydrogenedentes bacterium]|nr:sulfatase-like hydrolase/transferase [Candidatus Hydrogenedentota bacterium]